MLPSLKARLQTLLLAAMAALLAFALHDWWRGRDADDAHIRTERAHRLAIAARGEPLPGTPDLSSLPQRLASEGLPLGAPVLIRIFKREFELEVWLKRDGRFRRFATYPVCRWSGRLGPKITQGDKQAPEGFYTVDARALNPASRWHRSFNLGFPNLFDRAHHRTGTYLMVHGGCSSVGCYAMTNPVIDELWRLVTAALKGGQKAFQVQVFPFRMTDLSLARRASSPHHAFWSDLKQGSDLFDQHALPPRVHLCRGRYAFEPPTPDADGSAPIEARCPQEASAAGAGRTVP